MRSLIYSTLILWIFVFGADILSAKCILSINDRQYVSTGQYKPDQCLFTCNKKLKIMTPEYPKGILLKVTCMITDYIIFKKCSFVLRNKFTKVFRPSVCNRRIGELNHYR